MKKNILKWLALFAVLVLPLAQSRTIYAQDETTGTYQVFVPYIQNTGYRFLPWLINTYVPPWTGPVGGTIPTIVYDPHSPSIVYLASWDGGVYKSFDGGDSWIPINRGIPTVQINTIAIDPNDSNVIYAAPYRYGIYKSIDGGMTWNSMNTGVQREAVVYSIAIDPTNSDVLYISTRCWDNPFHSPWQGILYKSSNGGASWAPSLINAGGAGEQDWIYSIAIERQNPSILYAAGHETGAYKSTDAGKTWISVNNGLTDNSGRSIAIDPNTSSPTAKVFIAFWHHAGVSTTSDSAQHWKSTGTLYAKIYSISLDPNNASTIYASTFDRGLFRTSNAGGSWSNIGFDGLFFYTVAVNPLDSNVLLAGANTRGLWKSLDGGKSWSQVKWGFTGSATFASLSEMTEFSAEFIGQ